MLAGAYVRIRRPYWRTCQLSAHLPCVLNEVVMWNSSASHYIDEY